MAHGIGWGGMGWDDIGWDGMGWDGMGWDGMGWAHVPRSGLEFNVQQPRLRPFGYEGGGRGGGGGHALLHGCLHLNR